MNGLRYNEIFLLSLFLTVFIEITLYGLLRKILLRLSLISSDEKIIAIIPLASILTLPYLWFLLPAYVQGVSYIVIGEGLVVLIEGLMYMIYTKLNWKQALTLSLLLNVLSFVIGRELLLLLLK